MNHDLGGKWWAGMAWILEAVISGYCWNYLLTVFGLALFHSKESIQTLNRTPMSHVYVLYWVTLKLWSFPGLKFLKESRDRVQRKSLKACIYFKMGKLCEATIHSQPPILTSNFDISSTVMQLCVYTGAMYSYICVCILIFIHAYINIHKNQCCLILILTVILSGRSSFPFWRWENWVSEKLYQLLWVRQGARRERAGVGDSDVWSWVHTIPTTFSHRNNWGQIFLKSMGIFSFF